ncbi:MAG: hypothetical protein Q8P67_19585, partial [archaeon]|nr:hypothetical protein [archaeon]
ADLARLAIMATTMTPLRASVFQSIASRLMAVPRSSTDPVAFITSWLSPAARPTASAPRLKTARCSGEMDMSFVSHSQAALILWVDLVFNFEQDWVSHLPLLIANSLLLHPSVGVSLVRNLLQGITAHMPSEGDRVRAVLRFLDHKESVPLEEEEFIHSLFSLLSSVYSQDIVARVLEISLEWGLQVPDEAIAMDAYRLYCTLSHGGRYADLGMLTLRIFAGLSAGDSARVHVLVDLMCSLSSANPDDTALRQQVCQIGGLLLNTSLRAQYTHGVELLLTIGDRDLGTHFFKAWTEYDTQILPLLLLGMTHPETQGKTLQLLEHLALSHPSASALSRRDALLYILLLFSSIENATVLGRVEKFLLAMSIPAYRELATLASDQAEKQYSRDPQAYLNTVFFPALARLHPQRGDFEFCLDILIVLLVCSDIPAQKLTLLRALQAVLLNYPTFPVRNDQRRFIIDLVALYSQSVASRMVAQAAQAILPFAVVLVGSDASSQTPLGLFSFIRAALPSNFKVFNDNPILFPGDERPNFFVRLFQSLSVFTHLVLQLSPAAAAPLIALLTDMFRNIEETVFPALDNSGRGEASSESARRKSVRLSKVIKQSESIAAASSTGLGGGGGRPSSFSKPVPSVPTTPSSSIASSFAKPKGPPPTPPPKSTS